MDSHYAATTECVDCAPSGNRFMTHIRTHPGRATSDDALRVLVYQCIRCRRLRSEAYDAGSASPRPSRPAEERAS